MILSRSLLALLCVCGTTSQARAEFLEDFPQLNELVFKEPVSPIRLGASVVPIGIMKDKTFLGFSPLQAHWKSGWLDWEIASCWIGISNARNKYADSRSFFARTVPKFRILESLSIGPVVGYELITYPEIGSKIYKGRWFTPAEPFSSRGVAYGGMISLSFPMGKQTLRISPMYLARTYPYKSLKNGWAYIYTHPEVQTDAAVEELAPESLIAIEIGIML